jgi:hypothetical protein
MGGNLGHANCLLPGCGRELTTGQPYGPECMRRIRDARQAAENVLRVRFTWQQIEDAGELIELGVAVPVTGRRRTFSIPASKGNGFYTTSPESCDCPRGLRGYPCKHQAVATVLSTASFRNVA